MSSRSPRNLILSAFFVLAFALTGRGAVTLPRIFGDHMMLQRELPIRVWGQAASGERVTVRFERQERRATSDAEGRWSVTLAPMTASAEPRELIVSGENTITLHDVLVGEVWLCSGQSNMEMAVGVFTAGAQPETKHDPALAAEIATASYPELRLFRVEKKLQPPDVVTDGWTSCSGEPLAQFSAAGFFFARELQRALGVPVGVIESAWGGSRIEEWIPDAAYATLQGRLGEDAARCFETDGKVAGRDYEGMIAPLAPFSLRGVLWYQGESNLIVYNDGLRYADKFAVLVASWREAWVREELPVYAVQIAPYVYSQRKDNIPHDPEELPKLWEAQQLATRIPHTGLVPISDTVMDVRDIHPGGKAVVGHRLAALALARTYGRRDVVAAGPVFDGAEFRDGTAIVRFANAAEGLVTADGNPPTDFEVAGADGRFVPATAAIRGSTVEVSAPEVASPVMVRFAWNETARPNLANRAGWPAYPFRSNPPTWRVPPANDHQR